MPYRYEPCVTGETYHVFNRSVAGQVIFKNHTDYLRMYELLSFYLFEKPILNYSTYIRLKYEAKIVAMTRMKMLQSHQCKVISFAIMPTHIHIQMKQVVDGGISDFMRHIQDSYAKYHNIRYKKAGAVFQSMFKAVRIESDEQLLHVHRYIHLNHTTSGILKHEEELLTYPWSSMIDYCGNRKENWIDTSLVLSQFSSLESYKSFIFDQIDYQRTLHAIGKMGEEDDVTTDPF